MSDSTQSEVVDSTTEKEKEEVVVTSEDNKVHDEMVSRSELKKALDDMHKFKRMAKDLEDKLSTREMDELKKQEEWKKVAQIKEKEALDYKSEAEKLRSSIVWEKKFASLKECALKSGIRKEALPDLELLDFEDDVAIESTSTGRVNVLGADQAIAKLKSSKPHWFSTRGSSVNSSSPEVISGGKISMKDIFDAEKKAKESGDYAPYMKVLREYQSQN